MQQISSGAGGSEKSVRDGPEQKGSGRKLFGEPFPFCRTIWLAGWLTAFSAEFS